MAQALVQITTWNVGSINPSAMGNFTPFASPLKQQADIHVIGLQEAKPLSDDNWQKALSQMAGNGYSFKKSGSINGLRSLVLLVFVLKSLDNRFAFQETSVATSQVRGKGAVSINLKAGRYGDFMSFTGAHLTPHEGKVKQRYKDYHEIMEKTKFKSGSRIRDHQFAFFFGDLNFRLANINETLARNLINKAKETADKTLLEKLFQNDELTQARLDKKAFDEFQESDPSHFYPTYKMVPGTIDGYSSKRIPSWTDRILYREKDMNSGFKIKQLYYDSVPSAMQSDHKPVVGVFRVDLPTV